MTRSADTPSPLDQRPHVNTAQRNMHISAIHRATVKLSIYKTVCSLCGTALVRDNKISRYRTAIQLLNEGWTYGEYRTSPGCSGNGVLCPDCSRSP